MILLIHALFGAAIGSIIKNIPLAVILAFLSHYFLDVIPHIEYPLQKNLNWKKNWRGVASDASKAILDFLLGVLFVFIFSKNRPIIYLYASVAILPDIISILSRVLPYKFLKAYHYFHVEKVHFLKNKKISSFWRILSQIIVFALSIMLFRI